MSGLVSITGDQRGESALAHLPVLGNPVEEVLIEARGLSHIDAFTAVTLRALVEYHGRHGQQTVTFRPPEGATTWSVLSNLMGRDLPRHFCLARETSPPASRARAAVLPTQRVETLDVADLIADGLPDVIGDEYGRRNARFLAGAFGALAENALVHGSRSPTSALAAIGFDREANALQLVVNDLGKGLSLADDPEEAVIDLVERSGDTGGGIAGLARDAERKEIDLDLRIASSGGRLSWRGGVPKVSAAQAVPGFTAAAIVHLES